MNLGINMNTPERIEMALAAKSLQQRAEMDTAESFVNEAARLRETPEELRARWDNDRGYKREWNRRYRAARRRLSELKRMDYADGIM